MDMYSALAKSGILMAKKVPMSTFLFGRFSFLFVVMSLFFSPGFHPPLASEGDKPSDFFMSFHSLRDIGIFAVQ